MSQLPFPSPELIPRITLRDRQEHDFLEFLQYHVVRLADGLQLLVQIIERLDRSFIRDLAQRPGDLRQHRPVGVRILEFC